MTQNLICGIIKINDGNQQNNKNNLFNMEDNNVMILMKFMISVMGIGQFYVKMGENSLNHVKGD